MDIKGESRVNLEAFHKGKAGAVCERKVFIIIFVKDLPTSFPVERCNRFYDEEGIGFKDITKLDSSFTAYGSRKEIKGFYKDQIGCNQVPSLVNEAGIELAGYLCILIISVGDSDPCSCINEDPHFEDLIRRFLPYRYSS